MILNGLCNLYFQHQQPGSFDQWLLKMIASLMVLGGVLLVGHNSWRTQKKLYSLKLLQQQKSKTERLKSEGGSEANTNLVTSPKKKRRTVKELGSLSIAMAFSAAGNLYYQPLYFCAPIFILFAVRKRFRVAFQSLKKKEIDVETLQSLSIIGAIAGLHFFVASLLAFINVLGDVLTSRIIRKSHHQLIDIFQDIPKTVWVLKDGVELECPLTEIQVGDILVVSAGETIPADGKIVWGSAGIDEHRFTGESIPVEKSEDDQVYAMTLVLSGKIHLEIEKAGSETSAMKIAEVLNQTSDYKSSTVLESEAFSRQLVKPALLTSAIALPLSGFNAAVGVLYAHPKERLKVAAPLSLLRYLKQSMDEGILIKDGRSLELLSQVDTIVFDKTGTLTEEQPKIGSIYPLANYDTDDILCFAATAEHKQKHPLALAILDEAKRRKLNISEPEHSECHLGYGIKVRNKEHTIVVGSPRFIQSEGAKISEFAEQLQDNARQQGHGLIMVAVDKKLIGCIELLPTLRSEAESVINALKKLKQIKKTYIISGDMEAPTARLAKELGIDHYFAQTLPLQKAELIEQLQQQGNFVCYIGDGINDTIAMKQAQVSISLNGASQLATDTAQILLLDKGIGHLPRLFELAQGFSRHMRIQLSVILVPSMLGISTIFLTGMGMSGMMFLNMGSLITSISYALFDRPKQKNDQQ